MSHSQAVLEFEGFTFDPRSLELFAQGRAADLPPTPARLLGVFLSRPGELLSRQEIWDAVWPEDRIDRDQKLNYAIHQLRRALDDDPADPRLIQTLPRRGYRFLADVHSVDAPSVPGTDKAAGAAPDRPLLTRGKGSLLAAAVAASGLAAVMLTSAPREQPSAPSPASEPYQLARHLLEGADSADPDRAEALLWSAIEADSLFAPAWLGLALVRDFAGDLDVAELMAGRAIVLDPGLAEAHRLLGQLAMADRRWGDAERHLHAALRTTPEPAGVLHLLAHRAAMLGRANEASAYIDEARRLDPVIGLDQGDTGWLYYWSGRPREAADTCRATEELRGADPLTRACRFSAHLAAGDTAAAAEAARAILEDEGFDGVHGLASLPPIDVLERFVRSRAQALSGAPEAAYARARLAALEGEPEAVLRHLETAVEVGAAGVLYAASDPLFRSLRDDPAFTSLMDRARAPDPGRGPVGNPVSR